MTNTASPENKNPVYNILLLGQTQAGKSTFLQGVRRYADPACDVDTGSIGNGNQSHTSDVKMQEVETTFPRHLVYETEDGQEEQKSSLFSPFRLLSYMPFLSETFGSSRRVDVESLIGNCTLQEYRARIERTEGLEIRQVEQYSYPETTIRVFDTPGLEDTNHQDERNVASILTSLSKENAIHLVLIVISRGTPLTPGLQEALKTYSNIFRAMNGLMAVVHTHFEYRLQHPDDRKSSTFIKARKADLNAIMGREMTHFLLDCDLDEDRAIHIYLRQRTIREILLMATFNIPVPLNTMQLYKTKKMREVDMLIAREQDKEKTVLEEKYRIVDRAIDLDFWINEARYSIRELSEFIKNNNTDAEGLMREERYEEGWGLFSSRKEEELSCSDLPYNIDHTQVHSQGSKSCTSREEKARITGTSRCGSSMGCTTPSCMFNSATIWDNGLQISEPG
ncbi:hypothetical protein EDD21DRAFT_408154 [Dissophora ornata]|nr:hypothetical protein EDD21DRAFT_408154 [Dissophora ornata]